MVHCLPFNFLWFQNNDLNYKQRETDANKFNSIQCTVYEIIKVLQKKNQQKMEIER